MNLRKMICQVINSRDHHHQLPVASDSMAWQIKHQMRLQQSLIALISLTSAEESAWRCKAEMAAEKTQDPINLDRLIRMLNQVTKDLWVSWRIAPPPRREWIWTRTWSVIYRSNQMSSRRIISRSVELSSTTRQPIRIIKLEQSPAQKQKTSKRMKMHSLSLAPKVRECKEVKEFRTKREEIKRVERPIFQRLAVAPNLMTHLRWRT